MSKTPTNLLFTFSQCLRHAFMTGAGYGDYDKISEADQKRWVDYNPDDGSFQKISAALQSFPEIYAFKAGSRIETKAEEFARLVQSYRANPDSMEGADAWNLISEFTIDNADCISAALQSAAEAPSSQPDLPTLTSSGSLDSESMAASVGAESADAHHSKMLDYSKSASNYNPGGNLIGGESPAAETPAPQPRAMGTNLEEVAASIGFVLDNKRWEDCSEGFKETCRKCAAVADRLIREDRL